MPTALCFPTIRPWHHREIFVAGLERIGFKVTTSLTHHPRPGDVLVTWNRMRGDGGDAWARRFEGAGATVIVTENGWIGQAPDGGKLFALCRGHHNGAGWWPEPPSPFALRYEGEISRFATFGVTLKPWRMAGNHVLVLDQRGFGSSEVAMPQHWADATSARLRAMIKRSVRIRRHPGRFRDKAVPIEEDLRDCWAAVTWASGAGIKAIALGVPVFYDFPKWIGAPAAIKLGIKDFLCLEQPFLGDRMPMFERLAWAQFSAQEIATGEPIRRLLQ